MQYITAIYPEGQKFAYTYCVTLLIIILQTLGKVGRVQQIYHDNDLKVSVT